jgi:hypothetical protein
VKTFAAGVMEAGRPTMAAVGPVKKLESITAFSDRFGRKAVPDAAE